MTTAMYRSSAALSVPLTQNTAPVLEFNCLYTHDAHKKRRTWQDGFLRFHTFNKRVMVYDVPRNFIGDMHWAGDEAIQDGDEVTLAQGGVLVEVGDSVGQTETDLTKLRKSKRQNAPTSSSPARAAQMLRPQPTAHAPLKHKSLNTLLGTPKGPVGKAQLPTRSPFEERQARAEDEGWEHGRPPKRARIEVEPRPNDSGPSQSPKAKGRETTPLWARTTDAAKQRAQSSMRSIHQQLGTKDVIDLSSDAPMQIEGSPAFSDDIVETTSSPPSNLLPTKNSDTLGRSSSPAFQVKQAAPNRNCKATRSQTNSDTHQENAEKGSAAQPRQRDGYVRKGAAERLSSPPQRRQKVSLGTNQSAADHNPANAPVLANSMSSTERGQILRLSRTGRRRRTLLCHDQLMRPSKEMPSLSTEVGSSTLTTETTDGSHSYRVSTLRDKIEARLARINERSKASKRSSVDESHVESHSDDLRLGSSRTNADKGIEMLERPVIESATEHAPEKSATRLARLDGRMLPPAAPQSGFVQYPQREIFHGRSASPAKETRTLRRVLSDTEQSTRSKGVPGAPVRYAPSPTRSSRESTFESGPRSRQTMPAPLGGNPTEVAPSPPAKSAYRKKGPLQKSVSLNMTSNGTSTVILSKPFHAPGKGSATSRRSEAPKDLGPWSREAFDLFTWRPPGWNEDAWRLGEASGSTKDDTAGGRAFETNMNAAPPPGLSGGTALPMFARPVR
ncbi:hypothetical protein CERZMDRAFT_82235 [Cercospora zeae-maydis SCOH1-5]|uniref:5'-3' DNA helicase ZGRF1-like N-terminal domain-containing protein n=1 Tax=Cercospora zeae-maydis SCOH1-5 TaxID=717836 RepID=A0A6A6FP40_9PEZI|nr:hypothetical protein CERZMDRAFT_82235 [Cercospora zeae-maydis SCOH1-5]